MDVGALLDTEATAASSAAAKCFSCSWDDCDRSFARKSDLVRHFRIHTGVKPFECPWEGCAKRFIQRSALKVHFRTHSGERPHTCEVCDRSFSDSSSLARHRRTHTGVRPYGCEHAGCPKRFTRKTSLRKHMLTHSADYTRTRRSRGAETADASSQHHRQHMLSPASSATASPMLAHASLSPSPSCSSSSRASPSVSVSVGASSQVSSPLLSVGYLTAPTPQYHHSHRFHGQQPVMLKQIDTAPMSPASSRMSCDGSDSPSATLYGGSPLLCGMQGTPLPPISTLLH